MLKKINITLILLGAISFTSGLLLAQADTDSGIISEITNVTIADDQIPVVTFTLSDTGGAPLSMEDVESVRFLLVRIDEDEITGLPRYYSYFMREVAGTEYDLNGEVQQPAMETALQGTFESGEGTFAEVEPGIYTYTFAAPLNDDFDDRRTHVIGAEVIKGPRSVAANPILAFEPDGSDLDDTRFLVATESCNDCHVDLSAHGGSRKEAALCGMCHTPDSADPETGNSLAFNVLAHRIHAGEHLPSVQEGRVYYIVGRQGSIHDYSTVAFPQDIRNCTACHTGPDYEANLEATVPTCTSCHDNVDPTIGLNHPGSPKGEDSCFRCHYPEMEEFDNESIPGAHVIPRYSEQIAGVNLEILSVENAAAGQSPGVTFRATNNEGEAIAPADMDYLAVTLAGPTSDYTNRVTETIYRAAEDAPPPVVEDMGEGVYSYTFAYAITEDAIGTYAIGLEGYVNEEIDDIDEVVRVAGFNPVTYVNLGGGDPDPRRDVVALESCNSCHFDLALHGTIRQNTEYCVLCHNPTTTDEARRPAEAMPPVSINFSSLVHRIHRGEESNNPALVYGFGNTLHDYSEVRFPADMETCTTCHLDGTYNVLPEGRAATVITQGDEVLAEIQAARAVCTSCHDSPAADGHAQLQTTASGIETCSVCHGPEREFAVINAHP